MNKQEVLNKAIEKAIAGGWKPSFFAEVVVAVAFEDYKTRIRFGSISDGETMAIEEIIFNHEFAKALWGDEFKYFAARNGRDTSIGKIEYAAYKYHLQQMVIADNSIEYLGEHI